MDTRRGKKERLRHGKVQGFSGDVQWGLLVRVIRGEGPDVDFGTLFL